MAQLGHPYESQVKASVKRRLRALGATPGKAWGRSEMDLKSSYPKEHAGTERPMTIAGKTSGKRADRYAAGGFVGKKKKSKSGGHTTNIVIAQPRPPQSDQAPPRPVPVPVPVGAGAPPGIAPRPVAPPAPPLPGGGPPIPRSPLPPGAGPPGMMAKRGGAITAGAGSNPEHEFHAWGKGYKRGGGVKKRERGGGIGYEEGGSRTAYKGYPHSPESEVEDATSPTKRGGAVKKKLARGGKVHDDEEEDKKLFKKMYHEEEDKEEKKGMKRGGHVKKRQFGGLAGTTPGNPTLPAAAPVPISAMPARAYRKGGGMKAGSGTGLSRMRRNKEAARIPAKTELKYGGSASKD